MIKLLVIDDETVTRKGLIKHIKWDELGIGEVEEAKDGLEGLEVARIFQPNIILSDIRMPGMNGIELATCVKGEFPHCRLIFLSGYSDKEYLKAAIHLSAVSYIEKPINLEEVKDAVKKAVALCKEKDEKTLIEKNMASALADSLSLVKQNIIANLISRQTDFNELKKDTNLIGISFEKNDVFTAVIVQMTLNRNQKNADSHAFGNTLIHLLDDCYSGVKHICALESINQIVVVFAGSANQERNRNQSIFDSLASQTEDLNIAGIRLFCAVGQTVSGIDRIWHSYQTAGATLQKKFYLGYGKIAYYENESNGPLCLSEETSARFEDILQTQDKDMAINYIDALCRKIYMHKGADVDDIKNVFFKLAYALFQESKKRGIPFTEQEENKATYLWARISDFETLQEIKVYLVERVTSFFDYLTKSETNNRSVYSVMKYIQTHYTSVDLSNKILAESVFLTPTYLSSLFRKVTGKTISDYVIEVRMEKSKQLLGEPRIKLDEVAKRVGYSDANYYAKVFKRQNGLTPSEFREKYK